MLGLKVLERLITDICLAACYLHTAWSTRLRFLVAGAKPLQRLLALDGVQDPGNLGTLLRCATAFGWDAVWLLPGCCDPFNDKALRASRGAALRVPLAVGEWRDLEGVVGVNDMVMIAAEPEDPSGIPAVTNTSPSVMLGVENENLNSNSDVSYPPTQQQQQHHQQQEQEQHQHQHQQQRGHSQQQQRRRSQQQLQLQQQRPVCLVLGSEGQGLSEAALQHCVPVSIPMLGEMESLNVGVAGGLLMFVLSGGLPQLQHTLSSLQLLPSMHNGDAAAASD